MADLKETAIARLARVTAIDCNVTTTLVELYTVPAGKKAIIDQVVLHTNSATLAGMNDVDFGGGAAGATPPWIDNETGIVDMTAANDWMILRNDSNEIAMLDGDDATVANRTFGMYIVQGSTGAATCTADVFGYLV